MSEPTTKERLLDAAEILFAQKGYEAVSIREIAGAADVNLAAVNYHFQGKENLYREVLRRFLAPKREKLLAAIALVEAADDSQPRLEMLIRAFVGTHLEDALNSPRGLLGLHLMSREMAEPRQGARVLVEELIGPVRRRFLLLLRELLPAMSDVRLQMIIGSIVGQFVYYAMHWHNQRNMPGTAQETPLAFVSLGDGIEEYISNVIEHVTRFTLGGIREISEGGDT
ncbi:CerR family C-terminal domain-containing protein [bacterium]|nr:CerR family C-terminal domain-containing protein [bacterium]MBU1073796.1 CerR family C-terminal domain-containing protein [bacterium]MBU1675225.1 CerR family C-terminal domain-containing protein [bacterium]